LTPEGVHPTFRSRDRDQVSVRSGPGFAIGNERRTTTIAYELKNLAVSDEQLVAILPGVASRWKRRFRLEVDRKADHFTRRPTLHLPRDDLEAQDTDIHNIMLMTPQQSGFLVFNFNSTREEFPAVEAELRKAIESIRRSPPAE
jgi:hypothetical protein